MIRKIEFLNNHEKANNERCVLYLVTLDSEQEIKDIKSELGLDDSRFPMFEFRVKDNVKYLFAKVAEICPDILGQALDYASMAGVKMSFTDICIEVSKMCNK